MTIYIETFLIQNILINFCLLKLVNLTTKNSTKIIKLIYASIFGAAFSVISVIFINNNLILNILKFMCSIIMISIAFKQNFKQLIFNLILLFMYTYAYGGLIISLSTTTYQTSFGIVTSSKFSLELITTFIIIFTFVLEQVCKHLKAIIKSNKFLYKIALYWNNQKIKIDAFLDTGNLLNLNGNPVIIIDFNSYLKLSNNNLTDYFKSSNYIQTNTVSGINQLKVFKIDKVEIYNKKTTLKLDNQIIAVTTKKFSDNKYNALLSPLLF